MSDPPTLSHLEAQRRVDRIAAFRAELTDLERSGVLALTEAQRAAVEGHHDLLVEELRRAHDIDRDVDEKRLSWGLRIASFLGSLALSASVVLFFYRVWGLLATPLQVAILVGAPILALFGTEWVARRDRSGYFTALAALVAFACFVLDLSVLGRIFNVIPTPSAFLAWGAFGLLLSYGYRLRLLLAAGLISLTGFLSAQVGTWGGLYWLSFGERPETFLPVGLLFFALPMIVAHRQRADFPPIWRIAGLLCLFVPILILSNWGRGSFLPFAPDTTEALYQVLGFVLCAAAIGWGIRQRWGEVVNTGSTFFVIFLYTKYVDWWWDWMPRYLFFLLIAVTAVAAMVVLQRCRRWLANRGGVA
ncbi:MAG: DUF2157 domain-containing protein [Acidobacteriota bacterium]